jgi:hypothetical protein
MRFVPVKTIDQQDLHVLHRARERVVLHRTSLINQARGLLAEYGIVLPKGAWRFAAQAPAAVAGAELSELAREIFTDLLDQLAHLTDRLKKLDMRILTMCRANEAARRLAVLPGVGPIVATALVAAVNDGRYFRSALRYWYRGGTWTVVRAGGALLPASGTYRPISRSYCPTGPGLKPAMPGAGRTVVARWRSRTLLCARCRGRALGCATNRRSVCPEKCLSCCSGYCRPGSSKALVAALEASGASVASPASTGVALVVGTSTRATAACAGKPGEGCRWVSDATVWKPLPSTGRGQTDIREIPTAAIAQAAATSHTRNSPTAGHREHRSIRDGTSGGGEPREWDGSAVWIFSLCDAPAQGVPAVLISPHVSTIVADVAAAESRLASVKISERDRPEQTSS